MQIERTMHNLHKKIKRFLEAAVYKRLSLFPATLILGPRQCGKSTLVKMLETNEKEMLYLDLQNKSGKFNISVSVYGYFPNR